MLMSILDDVCCPHISQKVNIYVGQLIGNERTYSHQGIVKSYDTPSPNVPCYGAAIGDPKGLDAFAREGERTKLTKIIAVPKNMSEKII